MADNQDRVVSWNRIKATRHRGILAVGAFAWLAGLLQLGAASADYSQGEAALDAGDYNRAIREFTKDVQFHPQEADVYEERGRAYEAAGSYGLAIADFSQAVQLNPNLADAYYGRGNCYFALHDNLRASADLTDAINLDSKNADAYYHRGAVFDEEEDYDLSVEDYEQALKLRPNFELAREHLKLAQHNRSNAARRAKGEATNLVYAALATEQKKDYARAISQCKQALEIDPKYLLGYLALGIIYGNKGDYDLAITAYTEVIQLDPNAYEAYINRSAAFRARLEYTKALADLDVAIRLDPQGGSAWYNRGLTQFAQSDYVHAIADFTQIISPDPAAASRPGFEDPKMNGIIVFNSEPEKPHFFRGACYFRLGKFDEAIADYTAAIRANAKDADSYQNRGTCYIKKGNKDKAIEDYTTAIQLDPKDVAAYRDRSTTYLGIGDYGKGMADLNKLLQVSPGDLPARNRLAWILATCPQPEFRDGSKAVKYALQDCDVAHWQDATCVDTLAAAYAEAGDFANAVRWETYCVRFPGLPPGNVARAKMRLTLYQGRKPYRGDE